MSEQEDVRVRSALKQIRERLTVAAICDVLDDLGERHQAMSPRLRPLSAQNCRFAGVARTAQLMDTDFVYESDPYGDEITLLDDLKSDDVIVMSSDLRGEAAPWGELLTTVAMRNGAVGCVCDGNIRDAAQIIEVGFPVFHRGFRPYDSKGRVRIMAYDVPIRCGGVLVNHGDIICGDLDGLVVIPAALVDEVVTRALRKLDGENRTRDELKRGRTLRDVYNEYGIL